MPKSTEYILKADDAIVWNGKNPPTRYDIDTVAMTCSNEGWNGTYLDVYMRKSRDCEWEWQRFAYPDESVLC